MGTVLDLRRSDLRTNVLANPYWITSAEIDKDCVDQDAVLFSFPKTKSISPGYGEGIVLIHMMVFETVTAFDGTPDMLVGVGSIATDDITTAGTISDVDVDEYFETGDIALGTDNTFTSPSGGDYLGLLAAGTYTNYAQILPADATVLCIEAQLTEGGTITVGAGRLHVLISVVPHCGT